MVQTIPVSTDEPEPGDESRDVGQVILGVIAISPSAAAVVNAFCLTCVSSLGDSQDISAAGLADVSRAASAAKAATLALALFSLSPSRI
jgi:hypothetical protein